MATHSSFLTWRIPWTEEPGGLQPMGSQGVTRLSMYTHSTVSIAVKALLPKEPYVMTVQEKTDFLPQSSCP